MQLERDFANKLHANKEQVKNVSSINPERISKPMRGKYLNTVDEVKDMIWFVSVIFSIFYFGNSLKHDRNLNI